MLNAEHTEHSHNAGKIGTILTLICTIHCIITPFLSLSIPFFSHDEGSSWYEIALIVFAAAFGTSGLLHGYKYHHRNALPLAFFIPGLTFFVIGIIFSFLHTMHQWHDIAMVIGGILSAAGQIYNLKISHSSEKSLS